ncbi:hypothetical protein DSUL_20319 [Desulfovibrionales bacterium]
MLNGGILLLSDQIELVPTLDWH